MLRTQPLADGFAARVDGFDLAAPSDEALADLLAAWERHGVLLLRGQTISDDEQTALARRFGPLERFPPAANGHPAGPELLKLTNRREDGTLIDPEGRMMRYLAAIRHWHKDFTYLPTPSFGTFLRGVEIPSEGGDTLLVDLRLAYEHLPPRERQRLEGLQAVHSYALGFGSVGPNADGRAGVREVTHPLVVRHRDGRRSLFLSPLYMSGIVGLDAASGTALIEDLVAHSVQDVFVYRHAWQPGDLLLWDNRTTMHRGTPFPDRTMARTLHRNVVAGTGYVEAMLGASTH